jgi:riboflavin synthase
MFTGIIEKLARVQSVQFVESNAASKSTGKSPEKSNVACRIVISAPWSASEIELGESIAVNGVCLTVAEISKTSDSGCNVLFFMSAETLSKSNLSLLKSDTRVNLERALRADARLSGHIVQGHVDGLGRLNRIESMDECHLLEIDLPSSLSRYCVEKGSIALNGVSLTINRLEPLTEGTRVHITLIPHTWAHTSFSEFQSGDPINVEVDVLAKYVEKLCQPYLNRSNV